MITLYINAGTLQHDHHRVHDDVLQDDAAGRLLAVGEPVLQRRSQLY